MSNQNLPFHKTMQFRNVCSQVKTGVVSYLGTVKLHGTNASIAKHSDGTITFHSKTQILATYKDGEFTLKSDNYAFAQSMNSSIESVLSVIAEAEELVSGLYGQVNYPLKISGEWCGQGIQKGVGISFLNIRSWFIFGVHVEGIGWIPQEFLSALTNADTNEDGIYSITDFQTFSVDIDFSQPEFCQQALEEATLSVESCCPVSKALNLKSSNGEEQTLGEGVVWTPVDERLCHNSDMFFKTKGKKHAVNAPKSVVTVSPEELASIKEFIEYSVTENRLEQGLSEVGLDIKLVGKFIGWVSRDVYDEEKDVLEKSGLTMKQVGKFVANKAREFYLEKVNGV